MPKNQRLSRTERTMSRRTAPSRFLRNVMHNGVGRYVCQLQRLTISFCKSHSSSVGTRDFIEDYLLDFAKQNPGIVVYLKPRRHRSPMLTAEYLNGYKEQISITQYDKDKIAQWIGLMKGRSGLQIQRLRKDWHTETPSIQGIWHPFMFKDTKLSVSDLRDPALHEYDQALESATEQLFKLRNVYVEKEESAKKSEEETT